MVNPVHALNGYFAILDSNYPEQLEWLNESEFKRAYTSDGSWTVILLDPGPPLVPRCTPRNGMQCCCRFFTPPMRVAVGGGAVVESQAIRSDGLALRK